ncbi:hypothetical protein CCS38_00550, partial [Streptomyces purpurogeneiscleroticus]|nr:hypothetical protein [Streptomyces purpurogeneiscleroticus]
MRIRRCITLLSTLCTALAVAVPASAASLASGPGEPSGAHHHDVAPADRDAVRLGCRGEVFLGDRKAVG